MWKSSTHGKDALEMNFPRSPGGSTLPSIIGRGQCDARQLAAQLQPAQRQRDGIGGVIPLANRSLMPGNIVPSIHY
jgi:hypothetical protein